MLSTLIGPMAACRDFGEVAQVLVQLGVAGEDYSGCLISEVSKDGQVRELGRYGLVGSYPSSTPVPIWDEGIVASKLKQSGPTTISNIRALTEQKALTPNSDIDAIMSQNGYDTIALIPLRQRGLLFGVIGFGSTQTLDGPLSLACSHTDLESLMRLVFDAQKDNHSDSAKSSAVLFAREKTVLDLMSRGMTNNEIATHLNLSVATVKSDVSKLLSKLNVSGRAEAINRAVSEGLI